MGHIYREVMRFLIQMDAQEFLFVLMGLAVLGMICLRGFGSRSSY